MYSIFNYLETNCNIPILTILRLLQKYLIKKNRDSKKEYCKSKVPISNLSLHVIKRISLSEVITRRRNNYNSWLNIIQNNKIEIIFKTLPKGICPLVFPVIVSNSKIFIGKLSKLGIYASTWPHLPKAIRNNPKYPISNFLAKHLVTLPVHQSMRFDTNTIKKLSELFNKIKL